MNWDSCNVEQCNAYCDNPMRNECFSSSIDIAPDTSMCIDEDIIITSTDEPLSTEGPVISTSDDGDETSPSSATPLGIYFVWMWMVYVINGLVL